MHILFRLHSYDRVGHSGSRKTDNIVTAVLGIIHNIPQQTNENDLVDKQDNRVIKNSNSSST